MSRIKFCGMKFPAVAFSFSVVLGVCALATAQESTPDLATDQAPTLANGQPQIFHREGQVIVPETSVERLEDAGVRMHTNTLIFVPSGRKIATENPDDTFAETPASMACVYHLGKAYAGCNPANGTSANLATGGWGTIALVDAYDDPNIASDLAFFSTYFGLPAATFTKVYANTSHGNLNGMTASCSGAPAGNMHWGLEESLDVEWAHAMAPNAKILLVEACSSSTADLEFAEQVAGKLVVAAGGGDISNSWGGAEFAGEVGASDWVFFKYSWYRTTYFASAGDAGWGAGYPSSSPWVVSAGGTTVNRDANGNFINESCWSKSGGGVSQYETWQSPPNINNGMGPWANYQYEMAGETARQTPDLSFNSDPASGVYVYDTYASTPGWMIVGGTSVASPSLAGIINSANNQLGQAPFNGGKYAPHENTLLYSQLRAHSAYSPQNFFDVTTGSNGSGHNAAAGYDQCTGLGSPRGKLGK